MVNLENMLPSEKINQNIKEENENIKSDIEKLENEDLENNNLEYEKLPQPLNNSGWFLNKNELLITYDYRPEWWGEQEDKSRINNEFFYSVKKANSKEYEICWKTRDEGATDTYAISEIFISKKFINVSDDNRNRKLGQNAALGDLPRDKGVMKNFWNDLITPLNKYGIEGILNRNYEIMQELRYEENEGFVLKTFKDYPENIQEEALKIINSGSILNEMLKVCDITHKGNVKTFKLLFLSYQSLFINEPVHQKLGGRSGAGKTDVVETSVATIPDRYVFKFRNPSPKFIHYSCENFNEDYNIIINDDVKLGSDMIELNKSITDPNDKEKKHDTVIDGKAKTFKLPGEYLGIYNLAKSIDDEEFLNRLFLSDVTEKSSDKLGLKEKIKQNINTGIKESEILDSVRFIMKAIWQWHIDKEIRVFNPYLIFLDVKDRNNRNVSSIIKFIKSNSFFKYFEREKINEIVIGSLEDLKEVLELWQDKSLVQDYKLDPRQVEILKLLESYEKKDIDKIREQYRIGLDVREELNTISNIATDLTTSNSTIQRLINGSEGTQVGLKGMGLVKTFYLEENNHRAGSVVYINPEYKDAVEGLKNGLDLNHLNQMLDKYNFTTLNSKKKLIYNFLLFNQIIINKRDENNINSFLKNLSYEVDTYDDVIKLLNDVKEILSDKFSEDKDFSNISYSELSNFFNIFQKNTNLGEEKKTAENTQNNSNFKETNNSPKMGNMVKNFEVNDDITASIKNEIGIILENNTEIIISEIVKYLPTYDEDQDTNLYIVQKIIEKLAKNGKITVYNNKITKKKSYEVFYESIYKLLNTGNDYVPEEIAEVIPDITPNLEDMNFKLEKIKDLAKKGLLFLSNGKLVMSQDFKNIFEGDSK